MTSLSRLPLYRFDLHDYWMGRQLLDQAFHLGVRSSCFVFVSILLLMTVLVTGAAGFIGFHLSKRLLELGASVVGFDNVNPYYDPALKRARIAQLHATAERTSSGFHLIEADLENPEAVQAAFTDHKPQKVVNLAAQAGVRYSIENPSAYIQSNLVGFGHILEGCRHHGVEHLMYASSSSVYGGNTHCHSLNIKALIILSAFTRRARRPTS